MKRRNFITVLGTTVLAAPVLGSLTSAAAEQKTFTGHVFPELGYAFDALEPYIDARTMELHYGKHHRGYYDKFMAAAESASLLKTPMPEIFAQVSKYSESIRNNGGGYYNHLLFWENMTPQKSEISSALKAAIVKDFGSYEEFVRQFSNAAKTQFGSGWAWLSVDRNKKLFVSSTPNQDNPLMDVVAQRGVPLLALDVWEHAYYLHYQNRRPDYVDNFWNIINWQVVDSRYQKALG